MQEQGADEYLGDIFGTKGAENMVYSQDLRKALIKRIRLSSSSIRSAVFFNDDHNIATSANENSVKIWSLWNRKLIRTFEDILGPISQVRVTQDAKQLLGSGLDSRLYLWDLNTGQSVWIRETDFGLLCCDLSPDNDLIVTGSDMDGTLLFWDRRSAEVVHGLSNAFTGSVTNTVFSPDGTRMAACAMTGPAKLYDIRAKRIVLTFTNDSVLLTSLAFSKDSRKLLSTAMNSRLNIYDLSTGAYRTNPSGTALNTVRPVCLTCCDFSTLESQMFACGTADGRVMIWDADRMENLFDLISHNGRVTDCRFTPSGEYLLTTCEDGTGRMWSISELKNTKLSLGKAEESTSPNEKFPVQIPSEKHCPIGVVGAKSTVEFASTTQKSDHLQTGGKNSSTTSPV